MTVGTSLQGNSTATVLSNVCVDGVSEIGSMGVRVFDRCGVIVSEDVCGWSVDGCAALESETTECSDAW